MRRVASASLSALFAASAVLLSGGTSVAASGGPALAAPAVPVVSGGSHAVKGMPTVDGVGPYAGKAGPDTSPNGASVHYFYAYAHEEAAATGAEGIYLVADPAIGVNDSHSLAEISVESANGKQIVEEGWTVDPAQFGDAQPHLFVFHWVKGVAGCYDGCGFVPSGGAVTAGMPLTAGDADTFEINYAAHKWNIYDNGTRVGYFPEKLWSGKFTAVAFTQWFGEIAAGSAVPCSQMGNGIFGNAPGADTITAMTYINGPAVSMAVDETNAADYTGVRTTPNSMSFGGPATCPPTPQTVDFDTSAPTAARVDGTTYTPSATGGASDNPVLFTIAAKSAAVCTIDAGVVSFIGPGSCIIDANQAGSPTFEAGHASQKFAVLFGQKITFTSKPPKTPRVKGRTYTPAAVGGGSGNPVVFKIPKRAVKVCRLRKGVVSFIGVGRCAVRANQAGNATYAAAARVTQAFAVHKAK